MQRRAFFLTLVAPLAGCSREEAPGTATATPEPTLAASAPVDAGFEGCTA